MDWLGQREVDRGHQIGQPAWLDVMAGFFWRRG
jgi:hypothetical protein